MNYSESIDKKPEKLFTAQSSFPLQNVGQDEFEVPMYSLLLSLALTATTHAADLKPGVEMVSNQEFMGVDGKVYPHFYLAVPGWKLFFVVADATTGFTHANPDGYTPASFTFVFGDDDPRTVTVVEEPTWRGHVEACNSSTGRVVWDMGPNSYLEGANQQAEEACNKGDTTYVVTPKK